MEARASAALALPLISGETPPWMGIPPWAAEHMQRLTLQTSEVLARTAASTSTGLQILEERSTFKIPGLLARLPLTRGAAPHTIFPSAAPPSMEPLRHQPQ